jgi:hypothetical protein
VGSGIAGVAAESAVSAIVSAEIRQRNKDLAGICNNARFEALFRCASCGEQFGQDFVRTSDEIARSFARDWDMWPERGKRGKTGYAML